MNSNTAITTFSDAAMFGHVIEGLRTGLDLKSLDLRRKGAQTILILKINFVYENSVALVSQGRVSRVRPLYCFNLRTIERVTIISG